MTFRAIAVALIVLAPAGSAAAQPRASTPVSAAPAPTPLAPEPTVAAAVKIQFLAWQAGKIDQSEYGEEASRQFTPAIIAQVSSQLQPLGVPLKFTLLDRR